MIACVGVVCNKMAHFKGAASEGTRAANLLKKREKQKEELEKIKQKISEVKLAAKNPTKVMLSTFLCLLFYLSLTG